MDKAIQNCFDICPSSKCLGTGAVQSRADFNIRTEEVQGKVFLLAQKALEYLFMIFYENIVTPLRT